MQLRVSFPAQTHSSKRSSSSTLSCYTHVSLAVVLSKEDGSTYRWENSPQVLFSAGPQVPQTSWKRNTQHLSACSCGGSQAYQMRYPAASCWNFQWYSYYIELSSEFVESSFPLSYACTKWRTASNEATPRPRHNSMSESKQRHKLWPDPSGACPSLLTHRIPGHSIKVCVYPAIDTGSSRYPLNPLK